MLLVVLNNGGLLQFNFETMDGNVQVEANSFFWRENGLVNIDKDHFQADTWFYTENGYLFFEKYYMPGFQGPYSNMAVRIKPLDHSLRELNRKYILPVDYGFNNMFLPDWNEDGYQEINFYDLFDVLYPVKNPQYILAPAGFKGEVLQIPKDKFESVIMAYIPASSMEASFPEIIDYEQEENGRMKLIVNAVWPEMNLETAFQHEVVIRVRSDDSFYYESNHVVPSQNHVEPIWYTDRLTEEEWQKYVGEME